MGLSVKNNSIARYLIMAFLLCYLPFALQAEELTVIGWIEPVRILPEGFDLKAKVDTGADNSSLGVQGWETFRRDDKQWIRFKAYSNAGDAQVFERPLVRYTQIKRKGAEPLQRPVVEMSLCIGNDKYSAPVNLSDRGNFQYRMLIGRSFLKERFLVDSARKMTLSPECKP
jgi:hypothetical protein